MSKRVITIVGGGQSGLQLGNGLLSAGYDVRLVQDRKGDDIRTGKVMSSQCMFDKALSYERELGLNFWDKECPTVNSINFTVPAPDGSGNKAIDWNGLLDKPAQAVDQRIKFPRWMQEFEKRGGTIEYKAAAPPTWKNTPPNPISSLSRPARARSPGCSSATRKKVPVRCAAARAGADLCQRTDPAPATFGGRLQSHPGRRRIFRVPGADHDRTLRDHGVRGHPRRADGLLGRCDIARRSISRNRNGYSTPSCPGRANARRTCELTDAERHSRRTLRADRAQADRAAALRQGACSAWPTWSCSTTRSPARAPTMPRNARRSISMRSLRMATSRSTRPGCRRPSTATGIIVQYVTGWTNALLQPPPPHVLNIMGAAQGIPVLAKRIANGFNDPLDYFPWFAVPEEADKYLKSLAA